jgi:hypothetical protein
MRRLRWAAWRWAAWRWASSPWPGRPCQPGPRRRRLRRRRARPQGREWPGVLSPYQRHDYEAGLSATYPDQPADHGAQGATRGPQGVRSGATDVPRWSNGNRDAPPSLDRRAVNGTAGSGGPPSLPANRGIDQPTGAHLRLERPGRLRGAAREARSAAPTRGAARGARTAASRETARVRSASITRPAQHAGPGTNPQNASR